MVNYEEARVRLTNINKLKSALKNKVGETLRITKKNFQDEELPQKSLLTARQKIEIGNAFGNNMLTGIKLNKAQLS